MISTTEKPQFITPDMNTKGWTCLACALCGACGTTVALLKMAVHGVSIYDGQSEA
jgi:hypothetical protein